MTNEPQPATPTTDVVARPQTTQIAISDYTMLPQTATDRPVCTWDLTTASGRAKLHQAITGASQSIWDACESGPIEFVVSDMSAHYTSYTSDDGELVAGPMLTLLAGDGEPIYHSGSPNVYESLRQLMLLEGVPPWTPPVRLRASRAPTRNKRMRCVLSYVGR